MKRIFAILMLAMPFAWANAQDSKQFEQEYTQFKAIEVSGNFQITLHKSDKYATKLSVSSSISDYVKTYVKGSTLYMEVDEKSFPADLKKELKARNAVAPELRADVYVANLESLSLSGKCTFALYDEVLVSDKMKVNLTSNASIANLEVDVKDFSLDAGKNTNAKITVTAKKTDVALSNNAVVKMSSKSDKLDVNNSGNSSLDISGDFSEVACKTAGGSKVTLSGSARNLSVSGSNQSNVLAGSMACNKADVELTGSADCQVNAKDNLKVNLSGSSKLVFDSDPSIELVRIVSSTLVRASDQK